MIVKFIQIKNGPYKEELLIRYGDHSLNQIMNKMQTSKNNMNMEEIMQMNQILKPYQEKTTDIDHDNIKDRCVLIEVNFFVTKARFESSRRFF